MKLYDIQTKSEIVPTGRRSSSQKALASASDLNPFEWSNWLYKIRQQLGRGTSRAAAYEDCRQHQLRHLSAISCSTPSVEN